METPDAGTQPGAPPSVTPPVASEWRRMGYDLASTYNNTAETVLTKDNASQLEVAWTAPMGDNVYGAPLQVGDRIYAAVGTNVQAFDAATGMQLWRNTRAGTTGSMAFEEGTLYLNDDRDANIVALDASDGTELWRRPHDSQSTDGSSSPIVAGNTLLIGGSNGSIELRGGSFRGYVSALDRSNGAMLWTTYTVPESADGASVWSSVSVDPAASRVYATTGNNYGSPATDTSDAFLAFDLQSGQLIWKNQRTEGDTFGGLGGRGPDADFGANPVLYEAMVGGVLTQLVGAGQKGGDAHAVRRDDGSEVWTRNLCRGSSDGSSGIFVNSTWSGSALLVACNNGGLAGADLYALDGGSGDILWERRLPGVVFGRISVANGVGFVGTGTVMEVFDVDTGAVLKSFPSRGGTVTGTITIANGRVAYGEGMSWSSARPGSTLHVLALP